MNDSNNSSLVLTYVEKLSRFFLWRRKYFSNLVKECIVALQSSYQKLKQNYEQTQQKLEQTSVELVSEQTLRKSSEQLVQQKQADLERLNALQQQIAQELSSEQTLRKSSEQLVQQKQADLERLNALQQQIAQELSSEQMLRKNSEQLVQQKQADLEQLNVLQQKIEQNLQQKVQELTTLKIEYDKNLKNYSALHNKHIKEMQDKQVITQLLSAKWVKNNGLSYFRDLIENHYIKFANEVALENETEAFLKLKFIEQELELINRCHFIYVKNIIGISGGFSSGKSSFINSFIKDKAIHLAEGINPVTAIPSYVVCSQNHKSIIKGYTKNGANIELDEGMYKQLNHDFIKNLKIDLKGIMPFMTVEVEMGYQQFKFENICFIDTPGYNPSDNGFTASDKNTALNFAQQSNNLIWVIGLDANGTIGTSDIEFIKKIQMENAIYFVLNKADLKSDNDITDIIDNIYDILEDEQIEFAGISAYSSLHIEEKQYRKLSLLEFLEMNNHQMNVQARIDKSIHDVFNIYVEALNKSIQKYRENNRELKSITLDILESGDLDLYDKINQRFAKILPALDTTHLENALKTSNNLEHEFKNAAQLTLREVMNGT